MILRVVDLETCGLPEQGPDRCRVCEVATVDLETMESMFGGSPVSWQRGRMWSTLVDPQIPIPPEMSAIHHITDGMVVGAPRWPEAAILAFMSEPRPDYFVAHNARFESSVLDVTTTSQPGIWLCTYKAAVTMWPEASSHSNQALRYWLGLKLGAEMPAQPHRALGDAYVTAAIARHILMTPGTTIEAWQQVSANPVKLPRFRFGKHQGVPISQVPGDYLHWVIDNITDDEDVRWTARCELAERREAARARSPV